MLMKQLNNDYLQLPIHLWDVYRSADPNSPLFHADGRELTTSEQDEIVQAWQVSQVQSGLASWLSEPCEKCQEVVCTCSADFAGGFYLPPE